MRAALVQRLVSKARLDPQYLKAQLQKQSSKAILRAKIEEQVLRQMALPKTVTSAS